MSTTISVNGVAATIALEGLGDQAVRESVPDLQGGAKAVVVFQCPYGARFTLMQALLGGIVGGHRVPPYSYPPLPGLRCTAIPDVKGIGPTRDAGSGWVLYKEARVTAEFGVYPWGFEGDTAQRDMSQKPWTTTRLKISPEVTEPPDGSFYMGPFPSTTVADDAKVGFTKIMLEIDMDRHLMPEVPLEAIADKAGAVNATPFVLKGFEFPRGCVLFLGAESEPGTDPLGNPCEAVNYKFLAHRTIEFNEFLSKDGTYQFANSKADGTGNFAFDYVELNDLP